MDTKRLSPVSVLAAAVVLTGGLVLASCSSSSGSSPTTANQVPGRSTTSTTPTVTSNPVSRSASDSTSTTSAVTNQADVPATDLCGISALSSAISDATGISQANLECNNQNVRSIDVATASYADATVPEGSNDPPGAVIHIQHNDGAFQNEENLYSQNDPSSASTQQLPPINGMRALIDAKSLLTVEVNAEYMVVVVYDNPNTPLDAYAPELVKLAKIAVGVGFTRS
jgi:hypothetical protein